MAIVVAGQAGFDCGNLHIESMCAMAARAGELLPGCIAAEGQARLPASLVFVLARRWLAIGAPRDAMQLLADLAWSPAVAPSLARDSLALAQAACAAGHTADAARVLERIISESPDSTEAGKARVLLGRA